MSPLRRGKRKSCVRVYQYFNDDFLDGGKPCAKQSRRVLDGAEYREYETLLEGRRMNSARQTSCLLCPPACLTVCSFHLNETRGMSGE